ncbi:MAG: hypothetical protein CMG74_09340 [Candidatus Marinimicrobia bacterium]|nr:hypothetical protein [Candidatus Neomarinimicrobiota bacterium]|tara:strand:- start:5538 stop:6143 length:606 start_codon:yes stop_codon:yes gene_type:complete
MIQKIFTLPLLISLPLGLDLRPIQSIRNWETLQSGKINIEWTTYRGFPISKAETILHYPINEIAIVINDIEHYPSIFKRVTATKQLEPNIIQIILKMPFPFDGRDYIIKYDLEKFENTWVFSFHSVEHSDGLLNPKHVRLHNAAGIWILTKEAIDKTKVTYAWNGELLGNFPDFALYRAWITQGNEILYWLGDALSKKNNS